MAESVDALVSNTSGAIHPGSTPGLGTTKPLEIADLQGFLLFQYVLKVYFHSFPVLSFMFN